MDGDAIEDDRKNHDDHRRQDVDDEFGAAQIRGGVAEKVADPTEPVLGLLWNLLCGFRHLFYDAPGSLVLEERDSEAREENHLRTCSVTFESELYEAVEKLFVGEATGGPELWVDAGGGEAGDGVDLVEEHLAHATL
jgi:hypothetical protein